MVESKTLPDQRQQTLERIKHYLNIEEGKEFVDELRDTWDAFDLIGDTPERTAYNVGLRDAFKFIEGLQRGDFIHE